MSTTTEQPTEKPNQSTMSTTTEQPTEKPKKKKRVSKAKNFPDAMQQEIRNLAALHARDHVMTTRADGLQSEAQLVVMGKVFHGSAGYASVLDALLSGKGFYSALFTKHELDSNRHGNKDRKEGHMLELLPMFHLQEGKNFMVFDKGFERLELSWQKRTAQKPEGPISDRNLADRALAVIANFKFALKYHDEYMTGHGKGLYPSGKKLPDLLLYIRQKMFVKFKGAKTNKSNSQRTGQDALMLVCPKLFE